MNNDFDFVPSNIMSSVSFDVLTMDGIDDPMIDINKLGTLDLEESYFSMAARFISETNREITSNKEILYKSISEATDTMVVLESFSNFFSKINDIIDKFIAFIKSLISKFITQMHKLVQSDKYIIKHKKDFNKFKDADVFNIHGYTYSFNANIPAAVASQEFNQDLFEDLINATGGNISVDGINTAMMSNNLENKCDEFRGKVLAKDYPITVSAFAEELFKEFRDGKLDTDDIEVNSTKVHQALNRFEEYSKIKTSIESDQKRISRDYDEVKRRVREISSSNGSLNKNAFMNRLPRDMHGNINVDVGSDGFITSELMIKIDTYTKAKVDQITEFSNIHTLAFSAKLDALKECYKQDKVLLYTALSKIQRTDSKREDK